MSPEFMLRPSLSVRRWCRRLLLLRRVSPEFMLRPSLSGLQSGVGARPGAAGVAGVYAPAFVERAAIRRRRTAWRRRVSPEFMLRPSLSDRQAVPRQLQRRVSPEFMLRPSLSDRPRRVRGQHPGGVSPEFMLRPSLSGRHQHAVAADPPSVAGVYAPAFVERVISVQALRSLAPGVAGVYAPAFVERGCRGRGPGPCP